MKGLKFLFFLMLVIAIVITSGYFILDTNTSSAVRNSDSTVSNEETDVLRQSDVLGEGANSTVSNEEANESNSTEPSSKEQKTEYSLKLSRGYSTILKPTFEVGQKFVYDVNEVYGYNYTDEYTVDCIKDIDGSRVFLIVSEKTFSKDTSPEYAAHNRLTEIYVNADDGTILMIVSKIPIGTGTMDLIMKDDLSESRLEFRNYVYLPWMLALKDGLSWTTALNSTNDDESIEGKYEYKVTGVEDIKGIDCFVVESTYSELSKERGIWEKYHKKLRWVDKNSRMLVKAEIYDYSVDGTLEKTTEINLLSGLEEMT